LSRPKTKQVSFMYLRSKPLPCFMFQPLTQSSSCSSSSSPNHIPNVPPEFDDLVRTRTIDENATILMFSYQIQCIEKCRQSMYDMLGVHPDYPFSKIFCLPPDQISYF